MCVNEQTILVIHSCFHLINIGWKLFIKREGFVSLPHLSLLLAIIHRNLLNHEVFLAVIVKTATQDQNYATTTAPPTSGWTCYASRGRNYIKVYEIVDCGTVDCCDPAISCATVYSGPFQYLKIVWVYV